MSLAVMAACQSVPETTYTGGDAVEGRKVAGELCADCHAIERGQTSPNPSAPPFSKVLERYSAERLARDLDNAKSVSYLRMPTFHFGDGHAADLVAYIETLSQPANEK